MALLTLLSPESFRILDKSDRVYQCPDTFFRDHRFERNSPLESIDVPASHKWRGIVYLHVSLC